MAIITYPLNGITYGAEDAETYLCTRTSGVYSADNMFTSAVTGANQVTIGNGIAWINNGNFKGKSICVNEPVALDFNIANGTLNRYDLIVLRFDALINATTLAVKHGTAASSPTLPALERNESVYELGLYSVYRPAGSTQILAQNISSLFLDEQYCGIMRDGVTGIPTAELQKQAEAVLGELRDKTGEIVEVSAEYTAQGTTPSVDAELYKTTSNQLGIRFTFNNIKTTKAEIEEAVNDILLEAEW